MNRITFEMLAKWMAESNNAKVIFDDTSKGACANMETDEISMPCDIKEHNVLAALALLMHEGGHLKISKKIPKDLVKGHISHNILNVMEDVRVDNHNFKILDNIRDFYARLVKDHVYGRKEEIAKEHLMTRCLINSILRLTGFREIPDQEAIDFNRKHSVDDMVYFGQCAIDRDDWDEVKKKIQEILDVFKIKPEDDYEIKTLTLSEGECNGPKMENDVQGSAKGKSKGLEIGNTDKFMRPGSAWDKGEGIKGPSQNVLGEAAFEDITRTAFKELLNIKERRRVYEGIKLNTDELDAFFTGEIDQLFIDQDIIKVKKSKIAFCLDASGSMQSQLIDGQMRTHVLVKTVRSVINIIKELQETEGLNISYDVWAFDNTATKLTIDNWDKEYTTMGGGTNLLEAFTNVQDDILANQEIDGNKLVILVTDGEVGENEIVDLKNSIIKHGSEVKCMVLGIGASLDGHFVKMIAGDNNILAQDHADSIVMDSIKTMIE